MCFTLGFVTFERICIEQKHSSQLIFNCSLPLGSGAPQGQEFKSCFVSSSVTVSFLEGCVKMQSLNGQSMFQCVLLWGWLSEVLNERSVNVSVATVVCSTFWTGGQCFREDSCMKYLLDVSVKIVVWSIYWTDGQCFSEDSCMKYLLDVSVKIVVWSIYWTDGQCFSEDSCMKYLLDGRSMFQWR